MEFQKGHEKAGGRKPGTPNKATDSIKGLLNRLLSDERLEREWNFFLKHADPHIRFEAFKLANSYLREASDADPGRRGRSARAH